MKTCFYGAMADWENVTPYMFIIEGKVTERKVLSALDGIIDTDDDGLEVDIDVKNLSVSVYETDGDGEHDTRFELSGKLLD